jgi:hypothetical protein
MSQLLYHCTALQEDNLTRVLGERHVRTIQKRGSVAPIAAKIRTIDEIEGVPVSDG